MTIGVVCKPLLLLFLVISEPKPREKPEEQKKKRNINSFLTSLENMKFSPPCVLLTYSLFRMTSLLPGFDFSVRCLTFHTTLLGLPLLIPFMLVLKESILSNDPTSLLIGVPWASPLSSLNYASLNLLRVLHRCASMFWMIVKTEKWPLTFFFIHLFLTFKSINGLSKFCFQICLKNPCPLYPLNVCYLGDGLLLA